MISALKYGWARATEELVSGKKTVYNETIILTRSARSEHGIFVEDNNMAVRRENFVRITEHVVDNAPRTHATFCLCQRVAGQGGSRSRQLCKSTQLQQRIPVPLTCICQCGTTLLYCARSHCRRQDAKRKERVCRAPYRCRLSTQPTRGSETSRFWTLTDTSQGIGEHPLRLPTFVSLSHPLDTTDTKDT